MAWFRHPQLPERPAASLAAPPQLNFTHLHSGSQFSAVKE